MRQLDIIIILAILYILFMWDTKPPVTENGWTVYGTMACSWTKKQLDYLNKKGIGYTFVDCDKEACKGIEGFPYLEHADGRSHKGFTQV
jgi:hypothetical protein|tara:strand:+ start:159 stop:425 length:267 start_codon:yes stop_codon:yes gene_type:complete